MKYVYFGFDYEYTLAIAKIFVYSVKKSALKDILLMLYNADALQRYNAKCVNEKFTRSRG